MTDPFIPFVPANVIPGETSPFFPSQATTQTGEPMQIKASNQAKFKPGKGLKDAIN